MWLLLFLTDLAPPHPHGFCRKHVLTLEVGGCETLNNVISEPQRPRGKMCDTFAVLPFLSFGAASEISCGLPFHTRRMSLHTGYNLKSNWLLLEFSSRSFGALEVEERLVCRRGTLPQGVKTFRGLKYSMVGNMVVLFRS